MTKTLEFVGRRVDPRPDPPPDVRAQLRAVLAVPIHSTDPNVLTAAKALGWSRASIYRAVQENELPAVRVSRTRLVVSTKVLLDLVDGDAS